MTPTPAIQFRSPAAPTEPEAVLGRVGVRRRTGMWLVVAGLSVAALSALGLGAVNSPGPPEPEAVEPATPTVAPDPAPGQSAAQALAVTVQRTTYQPGHSSGWHAHPGVHSVVVLSGTLTVYDEGCGSQAFGAADTYIGGQRNHLARNDSAEPVEMVVVYSATLRQPSAATKRLAEGKSVPNRGRPKPAG